MPPRGVFRPDFQSACERCGASPCVVIQGDTAHSSLLCGPHFFQDRLMNDWSLWNEEPESTE